LFFYCEKDNDTSKNENCNNEQDFHSSCAIIA